MRDGSGFVETQLRLPLVARPLCDCCEFIPARRDPGSSTAHHPPSAVLFRGQATRGAVGNSTHRPNLTVNRTRRHML
jgi:hypothetical protein